MSQSQLSSIKTISNQVMPNDKQQEKTVKTEKKENQVKEIENKTIQKFSYGYDFSKKESLIELRELILKYKKNFTPGDEDKIIGLFNRLKEII